MAITQAQAEVLQAIRLKEAQDGSDASHKDLAQWLSDALQDIPKPSDGSYHWYSLCDFIGGGESGTVYFYCDGDLTSCPYSISKSADAMKVSLDMSKCADVLAVTTYKTEGEGQMDAPMEAAREAAKLREAGARHSASDRDLIQSIHDSAGHLGADCESAATEANTKKAAQAMHDKAKSKDSHAASMKLGASCPPDCKFGEKPDASESAAAIEITGDAVPLRESVRLNEGAVGQDGTVLLKVISPGWGSSGYYSPEVLERDLPKIYPAGTKNFWNHQTEQEERDRPEGDLRDLASVTTEAVKYLPEGPDGAGGYVRAKAFETYKQPIEDLHKHIGTSIRARGITKEGKAPDGKKGPIIEQLTQGISIDYVTTPGAGGKILQLFEAARTGSAQNRTTETPIQESQIMAEDQKLTEALAQIKKLKERAAISDAAGAVSEYLGTVRVSEAIRSRVTARVLAGTIPFTEAGDLDRPKVKQFAEAQLTEELAFLRSINPQLVVGMGASAARSAPTPDQVKEAKRAEKQERKAVKESGKRFASLMESGSLKLGKVGRRILLEGRSAFQVNYNSREKGVAVTSGGGSLPGLEA